MINLYEIVTSRDGGNPSVSLGDRYNLIFGITNIDDILSIISIIGYKEKDASISGSIISIHSNGVSDTSPLDISPAASSVSYVASIYWLLEIARKIN